MTSVRCNSLISTLLLCAGAASAPLQAQFPLDDTFGTSGFRRLTELGGDDYSALGTCPHADGNVSLVGFRPNYQTMLIARMRPDGALESGFSDDGLDGFVAGTGMFTADSAIACQNTLNGAPDDDRMLIAARQPGMDVDRIFVRPLNLYSGGFDASFNNNSAVLIDVIATLYPPGGASAPFQDVSVRGVHPGPDGGWLITGELYDSNGGNGSRGFIARVSAVGAVVAIAQPVFGGFNAQEFNGAFVGADGDIRVLGSARTVAGTTWNLLRLDPSSLQAVGLLAAGTPVSGSYRVYRGRVIGSNLMVAAALRGDGSLLGQMPKMLVVRGDTVSEIALPPAPAISGQPMGLWDYPGGAAATGAAGNRAVFVAGLRDGARTARGFYTAMVMLGNGTSIPDVVETSFGQNGASSFSHQPVNSNCAPSDAPPQKLGNISTWGNSTVLLGYTKMGCPSSQSSYLFAARLLNVDPDVLHRNGFE